MKSESTAPNPPSSYQGTLKMPAPKLQEDLKIAQALMQVLRYPDEDSPRLQFASLFSEEDPRREFVEAQLTLARSDFDLDIAECFDAYLRSRSLLDDNYESWRPPWAHDVQVQEYEFHRGFVELVQLSGESFMSAGARLFAAAPVRHLDLTHTAGIWESLNRCEELQSIRSISLNNNDLTNDDVELIAASPFLKELRWVTFINNSQVSRVAVEALAAQTGENRNLPRLKYVSFAGTGFDPVERYAADGDVITSTWLPVIGKELEQQFGSLPWLHTPSNRRSGIPPLRFSFDFKESRDPKAEFNIHNQPSSAKALAELRS